MASLREKFLDEQQADELRITTEAVSNPDWAFPAGYVVAIPPLPAGTKPSSALNALMAHSEPYTAPRPHRCPVFDHERFARLDQPRPEPQRTAAFKDAGVMARFGWTRAQLEAAIATGGFPKADMRFAITTEHGIEYQRAWSETALKHWAATVANLNIR